MSIECSVVVPLFNGELNLPTLHLRLIATLRRLAIPVEIIYVDDGSTDQTAELIRELHAQDAAVKAVLLSRSFGRQAALCAGMEAATGRVIITIDGTLQDPPELIPDMLDRWSEGYQVVHARCRGRDGLCKRAVRFLSGRVLRNISDVSNGLDAGDYALMDRSVVEQLNALPERTRSIPGLRRWVGFRQADVFYDRDRWRDGKSNGSFVRLARVGLNGVFAFSDAPLKLVSIAGAAIVCLAIVAATAKILGALATGWTAVGLVGLAGIQLLGMGVLGEYIALIHHEVRGRPLYIARERLGFRRSPRPVRNVLEFLPSSEVERQEQLTAARLSRDWSDPLLSRDAR